MPFDMRLIYDEIKDMEIISGLIERITFASDDTGFTVARLKEPQKLDTTMIVGKMPNIQVGEQLGCEGHWKMHPQHGLQFVVESFQVKQPTSIAGIEKYLASGLIHGIGPVYAKKIVEAFGEATLTLIDKDPHILASVPGIGEKRIDQIIQSWSDQRTLRHLIIFLQEHGIATRFAQQIYKLYADASIDTIQRNPYRLVEDIWGIGFATADKMALSNGLAPEGENRIQAGIHYGLDQIALEGNTCYPKEAFLKRTASLLKISETLIPPVLNRLKTEGKVVERAMNAQRFIWSKSLDVCEQGILDELDRLQQNPNPIVFPDVDEQIKENETDLKIQFAPEQKEAIHAATQNDILILTGGPGTGKSTITNTILRIFSDKSPKILCAAPTGRAAKRLSEITGYPAKTIHSLLSYDFKDNGFKHHHENPLSCQFIIVDESSMIDTALFYSLLKAIPDHARLILVGDIIQLPSVGPGTVLKDLIATNAYPVIQLNAIFRQSSGSEIIQSAHQINQAQMPNMENAASSDFFFLDENNPERLIATIVDLVHHRLPNAYQLNSFHQIQVLCPQNVGPIGTIALNNALQATLNPNQDKLEVYDKTYCVGDKVMQTRNNYDKDIYNGDLGLIQRIDPELKQVIVSFDDKETLYEYKDLDELQLAYACTVHKFQGSEYPCVIVPIHSSNYRMLSKKLIYTAITRGKQKVVLIGSKKTLFQALRKEQSEERYTGLSNR